MDWSTLNEGPHKDCIVAPDGWCFGHGEWAVQPSGVETLKDADQWLSCVKGRQDPTTRLIRRLTACLREADDKIEFLCGGCA